MKKGLVYLSLAVMFIGGCYYDKKDLLSPLPPPASNFKIAYAPDSVAVVFPVTTGQSAAPLATGATSAAVYAIPSAITGLSINSTTGIISWNASTTKSIKRVIVLAIAGKDSATATFVLNATLTTPPVVTMPAVTTTAASAITNTTAQSGGTVTSNGGGAIIAQGVCWSTTANPTTANFKTNDGTSSPFVSNLTSLTAGMLYHVRAYVTNIVGTAYGADISITTLANAPTVVIPVVTTTAASAITSTTAQSGGTVTSTGGAAITARGVCWSTAANPTIANVKTIDGVASPFVSNLTGLTAGSLYHLRAYATNSVGTGYGADISITTLANTPNLVSFARDIQPIIVLKCSNQSCHRHNNNWATYADIGGGTHWSTLQGRLIGNPGGNMPYSPVTLPTGFTTNLYNLWVSQGHLNN